MKASQVLAISCVKPTTATKTKKKKKTLSLIYHWLSWFLLFKWVENQTAETSWLKQMHMRLLTQIKTKNNSLKTQESKFAENPRILRSKKWSMIKLKYIMKSLQSKKKMWDLLRAGSCTSWVSDQLSIWAKGKA